MGKPVCPVCNKPVNSNSSFTVVFQAMCYVHSACYDKLVKEFGNEQDAERSLIVVKQLEGIWQ